MKSSTLSRRVFMKRTFYALTPLAYASVAGCGQGRSIAACWKSGGDKDAQQGLRASLQYTDQTANEATACRNCAYFKRDSIQAQCGHCVIFDGAVSQDGHCTSWSPVS